MRQSTAHASHTDVLKCFRALISYALNASLNEDFPRQRSSDCIRRAVALEYTGFFLEFSGNVFHYQEFADTDQTKATLTRSSFRRCLARPRFLHRAASAGRARLIRIPLTFRIETLTRPYTYFPRRTCIHRLGFAPRAPSPTRTRSGRRKRGNRFGDIDGVIGRFERG